MNLKIAILSLSLIGIVSCAAQTPATQGDKMLQASNNAKQLSLQWNEGNKLVANGEANQKKAQQMSSAGETQISSGEKMIADSETQSDAGEQEIAHGLRMQRNSKASFDEQFSADGAVKQSS